MSNDGKGQPVTLSLFGFPFHFLVVLTFLVNANIRPIFVEDKP